MRYSPGDRFNLLIPGSSEFSGDYVINADGRIILPFSKELEVVGATNAELSDKIEKLLITPLALNETESTRSLRVKKGALERGGVQ